ncbi:MAG: hypothetical protein WD600_11410, partial [Pseudohongiella sp.]
MAVLVLSGMLWIGAHASGDFALLDQHGQFHQLSRYAEHDAVVMLVMADNDDTSMRAASALRQIQQQLEQQSSDVRVLFFLLYAGTDPDRMAVQSMAAAQNVDIPVLIDEAQIVLTTLSARHLGEVFVFDPGSQDVLYRSALGATGNIGEEQAEHLQNALRQILAGDSVTADT